jgi:predicted nucleic acid-binding protein
MLNHMLFGEPIGQSWLQLSELALAFVLSALIGLEREIRQKSAGLRTYTLVGVSSALIMLVSKYGFTDILENGRVVVDPSRVAAQIVSGIGFIGGGVIFVRKDLVRGLTTGGAVGFSPARWKSAMLERLVLDFGRDHPQLIEFNSKATAAIINDRNVAAYGQVLESLDKASKKKLRPRFAFLCMQVSECVPLVAQTADLGIELLWRFVQQHNLKGTFRNSVNDMLILAAAIASKDDLITEDNLLTRFAARERGAAIQDAGRGTIRINFGTPKVLRSAQSGESKGYINRGWRIAEDFRRAVLPQH